MEAVIQTLARELGQTETHVKNVAALLDAGATIPFIARYRKELHGSMDDQLLRRLAGRLQYLRGLEDRKAEVKAAIDNQGQLTGALAAGIDAAATLAEVEDLYRPYKQKRRTRASAARDKGLEPLARLLFSKGPALSPEREAARYVDGAKGVETVEDALRGAADLIAEYISDDAQVRKQLRALYLRRGVLVSRAAQQEAEDTVYRLYYAFRCPVSRLQGYQVLALNRGEREGVLNVAVELEPESARVAVRRLTVPGTAAMDFVRAAADDAYDRLLRPSLEREVRSHLTEQASEGAIHMFALNLKPLLMQPPVRGRVTMGLDPGYRMGCKVAVVDGTGKVLDTAVVYPTHGERQRQACLDQLAALIRTHHVAHIAIGNGTASRETEQMTAQLISMVGGGVSYMTVSEAGASVYSASQLAAGELPGLDVNLRSAVSIARRLQDPLAELVKIDPKAIGVPVSARYCVNAVGVDVNTASPALLQRVSGLTATTAKNLVAWREENGPFTSRAQLLKVPKLGPKAFEQCAGFLRVPDSPNTLDNTGVHPESYAAAQRLLQACSYTPGDVKEKNLSELKKRAEAIGLEALAQACGVGVPTLMDMIRELMKPGRDPREELPPPLLRTGVMEPKDLKAGMELQGTVRNVTDFGAFVDIGVHLDGLIHISQMPKRGAHPSQLLAVGDVVTVWVLEADQAKKRISLTMKRP